MSGPAELRTQRGLSYSALGAFVIKATVHQAVRDQLVVARSKTMHMPDSVKECMRADGDAQDAVVCLMAGYDFVQEAMMCRDEQRLAEKEGWTWVRRALASPK